MGVGRGGGGELSPRGVKSILLYWGCSKSFLLQTFFYRYLNSLQYFYDCIHYFIAVAIGISIPTQGLHMYVARRGKTSL